MSENKHGQRLLFWQKYRWWLIGAAVVVAVALAVGLCFLLRPVDAGSFKGLYDMNGYAMYEFDGKGGGTLILGETSRYPFTYAVNEDRISFDFEHPDVSDDTYVFHLSRKQLVLVSQIAGTGTYTLTKQ